MTKLFASIVVTASILGSFPVLARVAAKDIVMIDSRPDVTVGFIGLEQDVVKGMVRWMPNNGPR